MRSKVKMFGLCAGVLALMLASQVSAAGKGPRASLLSSTECALDLNGAGAFWVVETTLTNKSSGNTVPEVREGLIEATYKLQDQLGNVNLTFNNAFIDDLVALPSDVDPDLTITAEFPLCDEFGAVLDEVAGARELNGKSTVFYGISGGDGMTRILMNRCTDDPLTLDVDEGAIKVDDVTFAAIETACSLLTP
jgi:hypothetical protein